VVKGGAMIKVVEEQLLVGKTRSRVEDLSLSDSVEKIKF
jgi:hypothetical protein